MNTAGIYNRGCAPLPGGGSACGRGDGGEGPGEAGLGRQDTWPAGPLSWQPSSVSDRIRERRLILLWEKAMGSLLQDLRLAFRSLARSRGAVLVVCVSIALAVAGNAAIFSIIEAWVLRPIPYPDASRLAILWQSDRRISGNETP